MQADQKVFFSYSRKDGEKFALQLATDLRNAGCNVWLDQLDIRPGKPWDLEIEKALKTATCLLFIVTEKSVGSKNTLDEVYYALDNDKEVIPVIFGNCEVPFRLKRLQHIDFTAGYDTAFNRLLAVLKQDAADAQQTQVAGNTKVAAPRFVSQAETKDLTKQAAVNKTKKGIAIASAIVIALLLLYWVTQHRQVKDNTIQNITGVDTTLDNSSDTAIVKDTPVTKGIKQHVGETPVQDDIVVAIPLPGNKPVPANINTGYYRLALKSSGQYIDADHCGTKVVTGPISDYADGACQLWRLVPVGDGWSGLQLKNGGQYLRADECTDQLILTPASAFDSTDGCQLWRLVPAGNGWSRLQLRYEEQYLDAYKCGNKLVLSPVSVYADGACQLWKFQ